MLNESVRDKPRYANCNVLEFPGRGTISMNVRAMETVKRADDNQVMILRHYNVDNCRAIGVYNMGLIFQESISPPILRNEWIPRYSDNWLVDYDKRRGSNGHDAEY